MDFLKPKVMLFGALMGLSSFVALEALLYMIFNLTDTGPVYPIKYLLPTFIISLAVWLYCFYGIRKYRKQNNNH